MTNLKDELRKLHNLYYIVDIVTALVAVISLTMLFNKCSISKIALIVFLVVFLFAMFNMDLGYAQKLEKEVEHPILRINTGRFQENPHKEMSRYIDDASHYNNVWRVSMAAACAICLFLIPVIKESAVPLFPYLFLIVFVVVYHMWNWKFHHSHGFILKSVKQACDHLSEKNPEPFKQQCHI